VRGALRLQCQRGLNTAVKGSTAVILISACLCGTLACSAEDKVDTAEPCPNPNKKRRVDADTRAPSAEKEVRCAAPSAPRSLCVLPAASPSPVELPPAHPCLSVRSVCAAFSGSLPRCLCVWSVRLDVYFSRSRSLPLPLLSLFVRLSACAPLPAHLCLRPPACVSLPGPLCLLSIFS